MKLEKTLKEKHWSPANLIRYLKATQKSKRDETSFENAKLVAMNPGINPLGPFTSKQFTELSQNF